MTKRRTKARIEIIINERFTMERDKFCWLLHDWHITESGKRRAKTTFHASLRQLSNAVVSRTAGKCTSLAQIVKLLENAENIVTGKLEALVNDEQ